MEFKNIQEEIDWLEKQINLSMSRGEFSPQISEWKKRLKQLKEKQENNDNE